MPSPRKINGGGNEWYTPQTYTDAACEVMGGIDLDPASDVIPASWINARSYYTQEDDGLGRTWEGRIWLNPPYSKPLISQFLSKLVASYKDGCVDEAIALTHNNTDTQWFHDTAKEASALCFTRGRIKFLKGGSSDKQSPTQGQIFYYFGPNVDRFCKVFAQFGLCIRVCIVR